jgi:hypothetical protein
MSGVAGDRRPLVPAPRPVPRVARPRGAVRRDRRNEYLPDAFSGLAPFALSDDDAVVSLESLQTDPAVPVQVQRADSLFRRSIRSFSTLMGRASFPGPGGGGSANGSAARGGGPRTVGAVGVVRRRDNAHPRRGGAAKKLKPLLEILFGRYARDVQSTAVANLRTRIAALLQDRAPGHTAGIDRPPRERAEGGGGDGAGAPPGEVKPLRRTDSGVGLEITYAARRIRPRLNLGRAPIFLQPHISRRALALGRMHEFLRGLNFSRAHSSRHVLKGRLTRSSHRSPTFLR